MTANQNTYGCTHMSQDVKGAYEDMITNLIESLLMSPLIIKLIRIQ